MAAAPFHTLKSAGFTDEQAEAIVFAIQTANGRNTATKSKSLLMKTDTQTASAKFRADIYRALLIQGGVLAIVMVALFTLFGTL